MIGLIMQLVVCWVNNQLLINYKSVAKFGNLIISFFLPSSLPFCTKSDQNSMNLGLLSKRDENHISNSIEYRVKQAVIL